MTKQLPMTDDEILTSYREARDKKKQVQILCDLNLCTKDVIIDVLKSKGVNGKELPRTKRTVDSEATTSQPAKKNTRSTQRSKSSTANQMSMTNVVEYINSLKHRKSELMKEVESINKELHDIAVMCSKEGMES